jgi:hypothetical protein
MKNGNRELRMDNYSERVATSEVFAIAVSSLISSPLSESIESAARNCTRLEATGAASTMF